MDYLIHVLFFLSIFTWIVVEHLRRRTPKTKRNNYALEVLDRDFYGFALTTEEVEELERGNLTSGSSAFVVSFENIQDVVTYVYNNISMDSWGMFMFHFSSTDADFSLLQEELQS